MDEVRKNLVFWSTDTGKICSKLLHDTNGGIGRIRSHIRFMKARIEKHGFTDERLFNSLNEIDDILTKSILEVIDEAYIKLKNKEVTNG